MLGSPLRERQAGGVPPCSLAAGEGGGHEARDAEAAAGERPGEGTLWDGTGGGREAARGAFTELDVGDKSERREALLHLLLADNFLQHNSFHYKGDDFLTRGVK